MKEVLNEQAEKPKKAYSLKTFFVFTLLCVLVVIFGVYVGNAIFGERSYTVLKELQKQKVFLYNDVARLKDENAKLQKLYLERAALDPDLKQ
ncbi:hypothetical protein [Campylobacter geochelonis]|uniref:Septum formation initiator n=1 Tax=Campylobacter geochelonis TaxID=1780362 RepID=A0A128EAJ1_9BACT|nr:hypothetical protein [Campylobacter geochelonis]QKF72125.1 hypothetical protein CGEO_1859 [Campylobacter geochelonis]CZE45949.1 Uncharacterised protein [Campylobacter geochelonis]CZE46684.1 Uncharacterised protein [Campylobacter geochelonis]CZE49789.1 Uncharacterised protein [Campylobacter geochelonis]